jgi:hypothetical protein
VAQVRDLGARVWVRDFRQRPRREAQILLEGVIVVLQAALRQA